MDYNEVVSGQIDLKIYYDGVEQPESSRRLLANGRFTGFLVEDYAATLFRETHVHVDAKGFDLRSMGEAPNIEVKSFTRYGAKLGPSTFYGAGRKADPEGFGEIARAKDFIVVDQTKLSETGEIALVLKRGADVAQIGHAVKPKDRAILFG